MCQNLAIESAEVTNVLALAAGASFGFVVGEITA
jgi:hypothetical protein